MNKELSQNQMFANFLGWHHDKYGQWTRDEDMVVLDGIIYSEDWKRSLKFDTDWNWFMPLWKMVDQKTIGKHSHIKAQVMMAICDANLINACAYTAKIIELHNAKL